MSSSTVSNELEERLGGRRLPLHVSQVFGDLRFRLDSELLAIAYDPDGQICTLEESGILRHWDAATGILLASIPVSELESCWAFSPDGRSLASGSDHLTLWDVETGAELGRLEEPAWMLCLAFSPDGKLIATGHDDSIVRLWSLKTGKLERALAGHHNGISTLAFNHDGTKLASAGEDRMVFVWNIANGAIDQKLEGHTDRIDAICWSPRGDRIASASWDTSVRVWDGVTGDLLYMLNGQGDCVHSVIFTPDGERVVCGDSSAVVRVWDYSRLSVAAEFRGLTAPVKYLAVRPDGRQFAAGGADRALLIVDTVAGRSIELQGPVTQVQAIRVSNTGALAAIHSEGRLSRWDLATARPTEVVGFDRPIVSLASGSGNDWAYGLIDGKIVVRQATRNDAPALTWQGHVSPVRILAYSLDGSLLASSAGADGTVKLWNATTGEPVLLIPEATSKCTVEAVVWQPGTDSLAVAGVDWMGTRETDGVIAVWNWKTRTLEKLLEGGATELAFDQDGSLLAAVSLYESIVVWDLKRGVMIRELGGQDSPINALAFDPTGQLLVNACDDGGLRIWRTSNWKLLTTIDLETCLRDLAFVPGETALVTGNGNSTCYLVNLDGLLSAL